MWPGFSKQQLGGHFMTPATNCHLGIIGRLTHHNKRSCQTISSKVTQPKPPITHMFTTIPLFLMPSQRYEQPGRHCRENDQKRQNGCQERTVPQLSRHEAEETSVMTRHILYILWWRWRSLGRGHEGIDKVVLIGVATCIPSSDMDNDEGGE